MFRILTTVKLLLPNLVYWFWKWSVAVIKSLQFLVISLVNEWQLVRKLISEDEEIEIAYILQ